MRVPYGHCSCCGEWAVERWTLDGMAAWPLCFVCLLNYSNKAA